MIHWPAIIIYHNDDLLTLIRSQQDLIIELKTTNYYGCEDKLMDSKGYLFKLTESPKKLTPLILAKASKQPLPLPELTALIQKNAILEGFCCSSKIYCETYLQAFELIKSINE